MSRIVEIYDDEDELIDSVSVDTPGMVSLDLAALLSGNPPGLYRFRLVSDFTEQYNYLAGNITAVLSNVAYDSETSQISFSTDQNLGTVLYALISEESPLSGAAIRAAVDGDTAIDGGSITAPFDIVEDTIYQEVDWAAISAGSYWLHVTQEILGYNDTPIYATTQVVAVTLEGVVAPVISDLAWSVEDSRFSLSTDTGLGTILYVLAETDTPLEGNAFRPAIEGAMLPGGVLANDYGTQDFVVTTPAAGTYYLQVVHEILGLDEITPLYSNVLVDGPHTVPAFDPADLAGARIVIDVSDMGTIWQNTDGTGAVTASGDPVGSVTNRGSLGGLFINAGGTTRPVYTEGSGRKYLQFDGSNDYLQMIHDSNVNLSGGYSIFLVAEEATANASRGFAAFAGNNITAFNSVHGMNINTNTNAINAVSFRGGRNDGDGMGMSDTTRNPLGLGIVEIVTVPGTTDSGSLRTRYSDDSDLVERATATTTTSAARHPTGATAVRNFALGCTLQGASPFRAEFGNVRILAYVLVAGALTEGERTNMRNWCAARAGF